MERVIQEWFLDRYRFEPETWKDWSIGKCMGCKLPLFTCKEKDRTQVVWGHTCDFSSATCKFSQCVEKTRVSLGELIGFTQDFKYCKCSVCETNETVIECGRLNCTNLPQFLCVRCNISCAEEHLIPCMKCTRLVCFSCLFNWDFVSGGNFCVECYPYPSEDSDEEKSCKKLKN